MSSTPKTQELQMKTKDIITSIITRVFTKKKGGKSWLIALVAAIGLGSAEAFGVLDVVDLFVVDALDTACNTEQ